MSIPDEIRAAFAGSPYLTMPQLATAMRMDPKTLRRHRETQNLPVHIKGTGVCTENSNPNVVMVKPAEDRV